MVFLKKLITPPWPLFLIFVFPVLPALPQIWATIVTPEGFFFTGINFYANLHDIEGVYFAAINRFASGDWLYRNPYDINSPPIFLYSTYLFLGKIAQLFNLSVTQAYYLGIYIFGFIFQLVVFRIMKFFFSDINKQLLAMSLVNFGGLSFLAIPEGLNLFSFFEPHFIVAQGTLILSLFFIISFFFKNNLLKLLGLTVSLLLLLLVHPWMAIPLGIFSMLLSIFRFHKSAKLNSFIIPALIFLTSAPFLIYYKQHIPWVTFDLKSPLLLLPFSYGPLLFIALIGAYATIKIKADKKFSLLLLWTLIQILFIYLPIPFQRRFADGLYFPIAVLSVVGLDFIITKFNFEKVRATFYYSAFFFLSIPVISYYLYLFVWVPNSYIYRRFEEKEARDFIATVAKPEEITVSTPETSEFLAAGINSYFFIGHQIQTPNYQEKTDLLIQFFSGSTKIENWNKFQKNRQICYIYTGPQEQGLISENFYSNLKDYKIIFENAKVKIYKSIKCP